MNLSKLPFSRMQGNLGLMPQEEMLEVGRSSARLTIGIPKETTFQETRIPLTPAAVALLCAHSHEIAVEAGAGENAHFSDKDYSDAGARLVYQAKEVFEAGIVLKISPPTLEEADWILSGPSSLFVRPCNRPISMATLYASWLKKRLQPWPTIT